MRAKKVFEEINFERHQDPKESLKIGIRDMYDYVKAETKSAGLDYKQFWKDLKEHLEDKWDKEDFIEQLYSTMVQTPLENQISFIRGYLEFWLERHGEINEEQNFERNQDPKKSMNIGYGKDLNKKKVEDALVDVYMEFVNATGGPDYPSFARWLAENIRELFRGATYGDYPESEAEDDYNGFLDEFEKELTQPLF